MQEGTTNKLRSCLDLIADFRAEKIQLKYLVDSLDGILLSIEEPLPQEFLSVWQDALFDLESIYALGKEKVLRNEIKEEIERLEQLISGFLMNQRDASL